MASAPDSSSSAKILVVDDERAVVDFVSRVLRSAGYTTMTATSGEAAIALCDRHGIPTMLLTDLKMPRMEGDVLASRLKPRDPNLKVLYLTGFAEQLFRNRASLPDGEAYLEKPCTIDGLLGAVSLLLRDEGTSALDC